MREQLAKKHKQTVAVHEKIFRKRILCTKKMQDRML